jgi:hypothetical protein
VVGAQIAEVNAVFEGWGHAVEQPQHNRRPAKAGVELILLCSSGLGLVTSARSARVLSESTTTAAWRMPG